MFEPNYDIPMCTSTSYTGGTRNKKMSILNIMEFLIDTSLQVIKGTTNTLNMTNFYTLTHYNSEIVKGGVPFSLYD